MYARPLALLALLTGCLGNGSSKAPYAAGLLWTANEQLIEEITTYRKVAGGEPVVGGTVLGAGESCSTAQALTGGVLYKGTVDRVWSNHVVGNTVAHHPLKPGDDVFNGVGVSVVNESVDESGSFTETSTFASTDEEGDLLTWEETSSGPLGVETFSRYHGVSADEYIVSQSPMDLWSTWEDDDARAEWDDAEVDEFPSEDEGRRQFFLLSKTKPKKGDIWTSTNGNSLFQFDGTEKMDVGGKSVTANRILVSAIENFDPTAADILAECFLTGSIAGTSTLPDTEDFSVEAMFLDDGCAGRFIHQQIGTEWWANNALVKFEGRRVFVEITDFGYEWYVDDEDLDFCTRNTSDSKPPDEPNAQQYVEYTVTVETTTMAVNSWTEGGKAAE